jgi:hypothetical protein
VSVRHLLTAPRALAAVVVSGALLGGAAALAPAASAAPAVHVSASVRVTAVRVPAAPIRHLPVVLLGHLR